MATQTTRTAAQIRSEFIEFFRSKHDHAFAPSSPVVPHDDPTLLFTNAGMNQFKDVFLGQGSRDYRRAVNSQKCIRAGGKHNDLEDVGRDFYHHTFFEMLGNWSFGDYFKAEAIKWAWELLTEVWGLDPERLHVTVFGGDEKDGLPPDTEAEELWKQYVPAERITRWDRKDNFWEMGETGPCGPCSEIHYDFTPDLSGAAYVNGDHESVIEIWNLVFMQFNRGDDGKLTPLPARHVDTGMGFERIVRVLQGKNSNYDTDIWTPLFDAIRKETGAAPHGGTDDPVDVAYRIIADHIRCLTVALADGAVPGSDGRGYVLRRILRRAVRHARQTLGVDGPLLTRLVPAVVDTLGDAFPELAAKADHVAQVIREEEEAFLRTLDRGIALFDDAAKSASGGVIDGATAFKLHDTFGFPIDLTRVMAEERGMSVDESGYEAEMAAAREKSKGGGGGGTEWTLPPDALAKLAYLNIKPTDDSPKYEHPAASSRVAAIWNGNDFDEFSHSGSQVAFILDRTTCYATAGGQVHDLGRIETDVPDRVGSRDVLGTRAGNDEGVFIVEDVKSVGGYVMHIGRMKDGVLRVGDEVIVSIDEERREAVQAHHTTTHLLNHALRAVIGDEVDQKGSLVAPDRLRFDFSSGHASTPEQIAEVEQRVRDAISADLGVHADEVPLELAQSVNGVRAVFGERYPDPVRMVSIGASVKELVSNASSPAWQDLSIEFCGGTHLASTGEAKAFVLQSEQGLAAGVRRMTALAGVPALAAIAAAESMATRLDELAGLSDEKVLAQFDDVAAEFENMPIGTVARAALQAKVDALRERVKAVRKQAEASARSGAVDAARAIAESASGPVIIERIDGADKTTLLSAMDVIRAKHEESAAMLFAVDADAGKVAIAASVPKSLIANGLKAGDWVREAAKACGGGGGGRPDMAQAGGTDPAAVDDAIGIARMFATNVLG